MSVQEVASQQDGDGEAGDHLEGAGHAQPPCPERQGDCPESHKLIPVRVAQPEPGAGRVRRDRRVLSVGKRFRPDDTSACSGVADHGGRDHVGRLAPEEGRGPIVVQRPQQDLGVLGRGCQLGGWRIDRGWPLGAACRRVRVRHRTGLAGQDAGPKGRQRPDAPFTPPQGLLPGRRDFGRPAREFEANGISAQPTYEAARWAFPWASSSAC